MAQDWTRAEVEATIADYFDMLNKELLGRAYNKTEHRRHLASLLNNRSDGAIERKHQNISAVLIDLKFPYISGYKPLCNYQQLLCETVDERLNGSVALVSLAGKQAAEPATVPSVDDILSVLVAPPRPDRAISYKAKRIRERPAPRIGVDFFALEARNRSLGAAGEEFAVRFETARLIHAGKNRLADQVERVSETRGDGLGFDVLSFEVSGEERLIEVKTTASGPSTPFYVTRNEISKSREASKSFHLYRAFDFRRQPRVFTVAGSIEEAFHLEATQFVATVR